MHLRAIFLKNFRLYKEAVFEFTPKVNVICGPNAQGKTSLLEAIYFLMTGRSFRTAQASDLIRQGASFFHIEASFIKHGIEQKLHIHYNGKERKIKHNATSYSSSLALLGLMSGTVMHPDDAAIVKGPPATRRHLLDLQLAQVDPLYVYYLTRYERAMRQRNHLLRARTVASMDSWEQEMANAAAYIVPQRARVADDLQQRGKMLYRHLCGGTEALSLHYKAHGAGDSSLFDGEALRNLYRDQFLRHRPREMELGATLSGPHKDDLIIALDDNEVRTFASEGQQRSCVVALRLAEWDRLQTVSNEKPLMLVDDLGMSLDSSRRSQLLSHFSTLEQVFVTTTAEEVLIPEENRIQIEGKNCL